MNPGEIITRDGNIEINKNRKLVSVYVKHTGDRPIQVGSHYHFFEVNNDLDFDREKALGFHLNIPSGASVRFEPGEEKEIELVEFSGNKIAKGFQDLVDGSVDDKSIRKEALRKFEEKKL